jgi:hypothetical protein
MLAIDAFLMLANIKESQNESKLAQPCKFIASK